MLQPPLFQQTITLPELESFLWEAANILRGSPVDRTDWKTHILPPRFSSASGHLGREMPEPRREPLHCANATPMANCTASPF